MNTQMLNAILWKHRGDPSFAMESYKLGCRDERELARQRQLMELADTVEPSDLDRAEWNDTTREYVEALESVIYNRHKIISRNEMTKSEYDRLSRIETVLNELLGDSDVEIPDDWTDDDFRQIKPLQWVCTEINAMMLECNPNAGSHRLVR